MVMIEHAYDVPPNGPIDLVPPSPRGGQAPQNLLNALSILWKSLGPILKQVILGFRKHVYVTWIVSVIVHLIDNKRFQSWNIVLLFLKVY